MGEHKTMAFIETPGRALLQHAKMNALAGLVCLLQKARKDSAAGSLPMKFGSQIEMFQLDALSAGPQRDASGKRAIQMDKPGESGRKACRESGPRPIRIKPAETFQMFTHY